MVEEIFGPVLTTYVYEDEDFEKTCTLIDTTTDYALTGCIFSTDRAATVKANNLLRNASGMFYINDKCTGAVVGQQPFGGARGSGTNDKAGSMSIFMRYVTLLILLLMYNSLICPFPPALCKLVRSRRPSFLPPSSFTPPTSLKRSPLSVLEYFRPCILYHCCSPPLA